MNTTQKLIRNKIGLLNLAEELGNISKACSIMGLSRQTFYRYRELVPCYKFSKNKDLAPGDSKYSSLKILTEFL